MTQSLVHSGDTIVYQLGNASYSASGSYQQPQLPTLADFGRVTEALDFPSADSAQRHHQDHHVEYCQSHFQDKVEVQLLDQIRKS